MSESYTYADGVKALLLYAVYLLVCFALGYSYTTTLPAWALTLFNYVNGLIPLAFCLFFLWKTKDGWNSIGLTKINLASALTLGAVLALLFLAAQALYFTFAEQRTLRLQFPAFTSFPVFFIGSLQEEIIFRGYIGTRLTGLVKNRLPASVLTGFFFLLIHYPVKWMAAGFSLRVLSGFYVLCLLVLHFLCDYVYRKTDCLYGSILLHFLYNLGGSMFVFL